MFGLLLLSLLVALGSSCVSYIDLNEEIKKLEAVPDETVTKTLSEAIKIKADVMS